MVSGVAEDEVLRTDPEDRSVMCGGRVVGLMRASFTGLILMASHKDGDFSGLSLRKQCPPGKQWSGYFHVLRLSLIHI